MSNVVIVDYGMGNLQSIRRAFEECGANVVISNDPKSIKCASRIVLPGVGAFADAMNNLNIQGWTVFLKQAVETGVPLLGICLGMQLLADRGTEGGETNGLGFISGEVIKFKLNIHNLRIPHVGWNDIKIEKEHALFSGISNGTDYYFVHSYHFVPQNIENILATTSYGPDFVSVVLKDNVIGVQFHPEKSQSAGFCLLNNFLKM